MDEQLQLVAKSYDRTIEFGKKGINLYTSLPDYIVNDHDYPKFRKLMDEGLVSDSKRDEIVEFLHPQLNCNMVDLGCCLNLMFNDYDKWESLYHGVDISEKTIELLNQYTKKSSIRYGELHCCSVDKTPFKDQYFDIATCIGVYEYFEKEFVERALYEAGRIIKPGGKFVVDIPNFENPIFRITKMIEDFMGRPDRFNMERYQFENLAKQYFDIVKRENVGGMIQYFLIKR